VPIKKGTNVLYQPLGSHYNEKYYSDPFKFRPERWISECDDVPTYAVGGFSGGARTCLGKHFAKMETKIALIKFFKRYSRVELPTSNIKMISEFFYRPKDFKTKLFS
jgi:cytochrome P450